MFTLINHELGIKQATPSGSLYTAFSLCSSFSKLVWKNAKDRNNQEEELIKRTRSELPDKLSYYFSIFIILFALSLNYFLINILDSFQILLCLIATGVVSSIPFRRLYKKKQSVIWILDWYGTLLAQAPNTQDFDSSASE